MHDLPRQKLAELLAKYGHGFCDDEKRLEAMLKDLLRNEHQRETFVLMSALREGVVQDLRAPTSGMPLAAVTEKLIRQLRDNLALDETVARRDLANVFAERTRLIAEKENLGGKPVESYLRLAKDCRNNLRTMLSEIEAGAMLVL